MRLLFGGITDRIEKRHIETGVSLNCNGSKKHIIGRESWERKAGIGSPSGFQEICSKTELFTFERGS